MPRQTFRHSASATASPPEVWQALERPETWGAIAGVDRILRSNVDEEGRLQGFTFESVAAGKRYVGEVTPAGRDDGRMMAWHVRTPEVKGAMRVQLFDKEGSTRIDVTLEIESVGFLSSIFFPAIADAVGAGLPQALERFAAGFE